MKKIAIFTILLFSFYSCYSYKPYDPEVDNEESIRAIEDTKLTSVRSSRVISSKTTTKTVEKNIENITPKDIIKEKGYYKLGVFDRDYKIEAVKWEGDSLIAHKKGKPSKEYKFNEKDIEYIKIRKFSKGRSDALTVAAYVMGGIGIYLLVK